MTRTTAPPTLPAIGTSAEATSRNHVHPGLLAMMALASLERYGPPTLSADPMGMGDGQDGYTIPDRYPPEYAVRKWPALDPIPDQGTPASKDSDLSADPDTMRDGWFPGGGGPTPDINPDDVEYFITGGVRPFTTGPSI